MIELHGPFAIDTGDDDIAVFGIATTLYEGGVSREDAGMYHGLSFDLEHVGGFSSCDEPLVECQCIEQFFFRRGGEARFDDTELADELFCVCHSCFTLFHIYLHYTLRRVWSQLVWPQ